MIDREPIDLSPSEKSWGREIERMSGAGCVTGEALVDFCDNRLNERARAEVLNHLGLCKDCREIVLELRGAEAARLKTSRRAWAFPLQRGLWVGGLVTTCVAFAVLATVQHRSAGHPSSIVAINEPKPGATSVPPTQPVRGGTAARPIKPKLLESTPSKVDSRGLVAKSKPASSANKAPSSPTRHFDNQVVAQTPGGASEPSERALKMCLLVGPNHIYKVGTTDEHVAERQKIEQDYADRVAESQKTCSEAIEAGADPEAEAAELKGALDDLGNDRDERLAQIYPVADELKAQHPEVNVAGNGPYQVVRVDYHLQDSGTIVDYYVVERPWPNYVAREPAYGWSYGRRYRPTEFYHQHVAWRHTHIGAGRPVFYGLRGHSGPVVADKITLNGSKYAFKYSGTSRYSRSFSSQTPSSGAVSRYARPSGGLYSSGPSGVSKYSRSFGPRPSNPGTDIPTVGIPPVSRYRHTLSGLPTNSNSLSRQNPSKYLRSSERASSDPRSTDTRSNSSGWNRYRTSFPDFNQSSIGRLKSFTEDNRKSNSGNSASRYSQPSTTFGPQPGRTSGPNANRARGRSGRP